MASLRPSDLARLREKAEQLDRRALPALQNVTPQNVEALVHELRVHQIELELQCQELQRAQTETEESRNRYRELYESIPIGYATIDLSGSVSDLNPAGAALLGVDGARGVKNFFSFFVSSEQADAALLCFRRVLHEGKPDSIERKMKAQDGNSFTAVLLVAQMIAALALVHIPRGDPFVSMAGPSAELAVVYLTVSLLIGAVGPGAFSLDYMIFGRPVGSPLTAEPGRPGVAPAGI